MTPDERRFEDVDNRDAFAWLSIAEQEDACRWAASQVFPRDHVGRWLGSPNPRFDGTQPMDLIDQGLGWLVYALCWSLADGAFS